MRPTRCKIVLISISKPAVFVSVCNQKFYCKTELWGKYLDRVAVGTEGGGDSSFQTKAILTLTVWSCNLHLQSGSGVSPMAMSRSTKSASCLTRGNLWGKRMTVSSTELCHLKVSTHPHFLVILSKLATRYLKPTLSMVNWELNMTW